MGNVLGSCQVGVGPESCLIGKQLESCQVGEVPGSCLIGKLLESCQGGEVPGSCQVEPPWRSTQILTCRRAPVKCWRS